MASYNELRRMARNYGRPTSGMTHEEARKIIGNSPVWATRNMARALSLHSWGNTREEWRRLQAAVLVLGPGAPERARHILRDYLQSQTTEG